MQGVASVVSLRCCSHLPMSRVSLHCATDVTDATTGVKRCVSSCLSRVLTCSPMCQSSPSLDLVTYSPPFALPVRSRRASRREARCRLQVWTVDDDTKKWPWFSQRLQGFLADGKVLVFVGNREGCNELAGSINRQLGATSDRPMCLALHGDKTQEARDDVMRKVRVDISCVG